VDRRASVLDLWACHIDPGLRGSIAQRTKKIRIGMAVCAIPFNHPLRTASDFALVGYPLPWRLDFGVGRAYQPHEFIGLGVPMDKSARCSPKASISCSRLDAADDFYRGKFWTIPEPVQVLPSPVQKPHPPIYQATISPESFEQAARAHLHLQMASPFTYRTYRERWMDELESNCPALRGGLPQPRPRPGSAERMLLLPFFVHANAGTAREIYKAHVEWFYAKVTRTSLPCPANRRGQGLRADDARRQEDARAGLSLLRQAAPVWRLYRR
jgi:alkanesulfonate monooxygenase SsuD/methylene tetrahydromethanopterin reductase-like flavin-dependent oxidoreductase (luciferase family)